MNAAVARAAVARDVFRTSRALDFTTRRELTAQIGHGEELWPLVAVKELVDNALDAAEDAGIAPAVRVRVAEDLIEVADNGPGIEAGVVADVLDFSVRVSSREAYAAPTRGAQGNALKTLLMMPFVLDGERGLTEVEAHGERHRIEISVDRVAQEPRARHVREPSVVRVGTVVRLHWQLSASSSFYLTGDRILQTLGGFALWNPHLTLDVDVLGARWRWEATDRSWRKWLPSDPIPASWYDLERFERLVGATIHRDRTRGSGRVRLVREFVSDFRGLSSTAKQRDILTALGLHAAPLDTLAPGGTFDRPRLQRLLAAMIELGRDVRAKQLGLIGADHLRERLSLSDAAAESFKYNKVVRDHPLAPVVAEMAFAYEPEGGSRQLCTGVNWSPSLAPSFGNLGSGHGYGLESLLHAQRCGRREPVVVALHVASPAIRFTDRGKSNALMPAHVTDDADEGVCRITNQWRKQREAEDRDRQAAIRRRERMLRSPTVYVKHIAWDVMESAYLQASDGGTLPVRPRQIMYAARGAIQEATGKSLSDQYFCQTLLPDYVAEFPERTANWDIVWDARGNLIEPHTEYTLPLGTLEVRGYIADSGSEYLPGSGGGGRWATRGPMHRFGAALFVEKEGFGPLFRKVRLAERHDVAIMSTKGVSTTAARQLVDHFVDKCGVPVYVVRDFDRSGFVIAGTLARDTRRYSWASAGAVDLGLRLEDVKANNLASEGVFYSGADKRELTNPDEIREKIRNEVVGNGGTEEELEFLLERRVELNAFGSRQLVDWIEGKLTTQGVVKVAPDAATLEQAARAFYRDELAAAEMRRHEARLSKEAAAVEFGDLAGQVRRRLADHPQMSWDDALRDVVEDVFRQRHRR